jgi:hypothetical protein
MMTKDRFFDGFFTTIATIGQHSVFMHKAEVNERFGNAMSVLAELQVSKREAAKAAKQMQFMYPSPLTGNYEDYHLYLNRWIESERVIEFGGKTIIQLNQKDAYRFLASYTVIQRKVFVAIVKAYHYANIRAMSA